MDAGLYEKDYTYREITEVDQTTQITGLEYLGLPEDLEFGYTYNNLGYIATYAAPGEQTITYTYDNLGQLLQAVGDVTYTYTYDSAGNILTANGHTYTYGDADWKDLLTAYDNQAITYDTIGNPLSYYNGTRWTFTWENGRSLATATNGTVSLSYEYDLDGLRTTKTVGNAVHDYYYAGGRLLREVITTTAEDETVTTSTLDFFYDASGMPYVLKYNGVEYYYITNLQGDVVYIVDGTGATVATYEYDPFGKVVSATGTLAQVNPIRYRGYYYDTELEMYYLQSRYYDPAICRFINADALVSTGQSVIGFNMFAYGDNNPTNMCDPGGQCSRFLGFLWKVDCGQVTCKDSKNYRPMPSKVAVIYDGRTSGYLWGLFGGVGFKAQGETLVNSLQGSHIVEDYAFTTMDGFVDAWNSLDGEYQAIYVISHGYPGGLSCDGKSISGLNTDAYSFWDLNAVSTPTVYLYCCNGATIPTSGNSSAYYFAQLTGGNVWAVTNGKLNFTLGTHVPYPTRGGKWSITRGDISTVFA